jgi:hypothetical protein
MSLPESCTIYYPILGILKDFFLNSRALLHKSINNIYELLLKNISKDSTFYISLNEKAQKRVDLYFANQQNNNNNNNNNNILKDKDIVFKMFINNCQSQMLDIITVVTNEVWNSNSEELMLFMRGLILRVEPWKTSCVDGVFVKLDAMIDSKDAFLDNLFNIFYNKNC